MSFEYGVGDIMAISGLALKVYAAYNDAPGDYRNISDEVESLHILIKKAAQHFESTALSERTALSDFRQQQVQQLLEGCKNVLEHLDTHIEKYSLASASTSQALQRIKLATEDFTALRARLISITDLLNGFIERFDTLTFTIKCIELMSCYSCDLNEMQAQLYTILGLHHTTSRDSIAPFPLSLNTKRTYKKLCEDLFAMGVTADMIKEQRKDIQDTFQDAASSSKMGDSTFLDPDQLPEIGKSSNPEGSTISTENPMPRPRVDWIKSSIDFLVCPLMLAAAEAGNTKQLISALEYVWNINFIDDQKETAVHKAAAKGHKDTVPLLLSKGASIEAKDMSNWTPLHHAARGGHTSTVELLLSEGASIEAVAKSRRTPLHLAAWQGHTGTVELLLSKGASIEAKADSERTSLHLAAWKGHTSTVELLLSLGASIEAMAKSERTPLHLAAWQGHTSTVELLLSQEASIVAMTEGNRTPLHYAASGGHTSISKLLLSNGASIEARDITYWTPLHYAAWGGHTRTVELLLLEGASIDAMDKDNRTPLHDAASGGHTSTVELLLSKGAPIEARDISNWTPLQYAALSAHTSTVELLLSKGAPIAARDKY